MASWDLSSIHAHGDGERLLKQLKAKVKRFRRHKKGLRPSISAKRFMSVIEEAEKLTVLSSRISAYASLKLAEDTTSPQWNAYADVVSRAQAEAANETLFLSHWFKDLPAKAAKRLTAASGSYSYMLGRIREEARYILPEEQEKIINLKDLTGVDATGKIYDLVSNGFMFNYGGRSVTLEELSQHKMSQDRGDRKTAYDLILTRYAGEQNVLGEVYKSIVNDFANENVGLRKYDSPISVRNHANDLPDEAVSALMEAVASNDRVFRDYFRVKAKVCGIQSMDRYDLYAPYPGSDHQYPYAQCRKLTLQTYRGFSELMYRLAKKVFTEGHLHSPPRAGKQTGAFCLSPTMKTTPYILLNHVGKVRDLYTMVHETGHAIHSMLAGSQTEFTFRAPLPLAENASLFGEALLTERMLDEADDEEKIAILVRSLDNHYASITRQAYFARFELAAHDMIPAGATAYELSDAYLKDLQRQLGKGIHVPSAFRHEWLTIPHIYSTPFYVYSYAFADLLVLELYRRYREEGEQFTPDYLRILAYGGSESPEKILGEAGIDVRSKETWNGPFRLVKDMVKELDAIA